MSEHIPFPTVGSEAVDSLADRCEREPTVAVLIEYPVNATGPVETVRIIGWVIKFRRNLACGFWSVIQQADPPEFHLGVYRSPDTCAG